MILKETAKMKLEDATKCLQDFFDGRGHSFVYSADCLEGKHQLFQNNKYWEP